MNDQKDEQMRVNTIVIAAALSLAPALSQAQFDFRAAGREVQVHGFLSQGLGYSNQNNFLTMNTSQGSAAMTDFGVNVTSQLTDNLRAGAQLYARNVGQLGRWRPLFDYAYVDYRFKSWLGVRAGRVKTQLGLYTSTQDADFLRPWALLPQAVYPTDLRSTNIAHDGVDLYGAIPLGRAGSLDYTAYAGVRPDDKYSGLYYQFEDVGWTAHDQISASMTGADLRWNTPLSGLTVGASQIFQKERTALPSTGIAPPGFPAPLPDIEAVAGPDRTFAGYADYALGRLHFAAEYRRNLDYVDLQGWPTGRYVRNLSERAWFVSASYRVNQRVEFGAYNSRYYVDHPAALDAPGPPPDQSAYHIFDQAVTLRVDLAHFWNVKLEGHFIDGVGDPFSPHGFYLRVNGTNLDPSLKPTTNLVVIRMGWDF
ncbi:MAG TPA: hypothetical protein VMH81_09065 [Bryobacteraceae bacterium]|nr:hypothetical protein [Bryobacteraceae bacterium]